MTERKLLDLVLERPSRASLLYDYGFLYSLYGTITLADACREKSLDPESIAAKIRAHDEDHPESFKDWRRTPLRDLIDHIVERYHTNLRKLLPQLFDELTEVSNLYSRDYPEIDEVLKVFGALRFVLEAHMLSEERVLFRTIRDLEIGKGNWENELHTSEEIRVRFHEHDSSIEDIRLLRRLTDDYTAPPGSGESYRKAMKLMNDIERELHMHLHLENNILFPRASQLANDLLEESRNTSK